jgi:hypothetical protein
MPLCLLNRHQVDRSRVRWDGRSFVGTCRHCGARVRRKEHKLWQRDAADGSGDGFEENSEAGSGPAAGDLPDGDRTPG